MTMSPNSRHNALVLLLLLVLAEVVAVAAVGQVAVKRTNAINEIENTTFKHVHHDPNGRHLSARSANIIVTKPVTPRPEVAQKNPSAGFRAPDGNPKPQSLNPNPYTLNPKP